jgi:hypothetical protein
MEGFPWLENKKHFSLVMLCSELSMRQAERSSVFIDQYEHDWGIVRQLAAVYPDNCCSLLVSNTSLPNIIIRPRSPGYDDMRHIQKHAGILVVEIANQLLTSAIYLLTGSYLGIMVGDFWDLCHLSVRLHTIKEWSGDLPS